MGREKSDCGKDSTGIGRSAQRYAITGHTSTPAANRRAVRSYSLKPDKCTKWIRGGRLPGSRCIDGTRARLPGIDTYGRMQIPVLDD